MRWIVVLGLVSLGLTMPGCSRQCFITEADYDHYQRLMPTNLENKADAGVVPTAAYTPEPVTVNNPEKRERRYLSLIEAIAISLENGTTGVQSVRAAGTVSDDLLTGSQQQSLQFQSDSNRVLAINPALFGASIEQALARWDVQSISNISWTTTDEPTNGFSNFSNGESAHFEQSFIKPLPTGGVAGITFSTDYTLLSQPPTSVPVTNPAYTPRLRFNFDHPLLQNYGTEINELLPQPPTPSPGSTISSFAQSALATHNGLLAGGAGVGLQTSGILIARLRFDQARADFERVVNYKLLNVETAYWNLYAAYVNLYASESGLRQAHRAWLETFQKFTAGAAAERDVAAAEGQYQQFRGDRVQALGRVLEAERVLRILMGLPVEDGKQLVPADSPTVAPYDPDWETALNDAMMLRPELVAARQELKVRQFNAILQENYLKPDLRFTSGYTLVGLGSELDGNNTTINPATGAPQTTNAFRSLAGAHFGDWNLGLTLNMPLGKRFEHAAVRQAKLSLAQAALSLQNEERRARDYLAKAFRDISENYKVVESRRAQRKAFARQVEAELQLVRLGKQTVVFLLIAERDFANALASEYKAIVDYNNALAAFEFAKGTIMQHDNVLIGEGPLPQCAQVRAVEHERQRTKALVVRERAMPVRQTELSLKDGTTGLPELPAHTAPSLPALMDRAPPVPPELPAATPPAMGEQPAAPATRPKTEQIKVSVPDMPAAAWRRLAPPSAPAPAETPVVVPEGKAPGLVRVPEAPTPPAAAPRLPLDSPVSQFKQPPAVQSVTPAPPAATPAAPVPAAAVQPTGTLSDLPGGVSPAFQWQDDGATR